MTDEPEDRLDLSAWEAPEPPAGLADHVIARVGGGTTIVASVPEEPHARRRRGWLIAGIAAATLAAAAGVLLVARGTHRAAPTSGSVIAEQARSLSLDSVQADLDPGAQVTWHREGGSLRVSQRAGTVAWRVSGDERLMIDAGATVATVEATGASLRVEVKMSQADARVIGVTALTAAVVSLVTVVVYEGHVKVSGSRGQPTVIVQPGSTYTVTPPTKPVEAPVVGVAVDPEVATKDLPAPADLRGAGGESATKTVASAPGDCDATKLRDQGMALLNHREHAGALALFELALACKPRDAALIRLAFTSACNARDQAKAKLYFAKLSAADQTKLVQICIRNSVDLDIDNVPKAPCDAEALRDNGMENINKGQHAAALTLFEASLRCKKDPYVLQLTFMEACASGNEAKANFYYPQMTRAQREKFRQICIRQKPPVRLTEVAGDDFDRQGFLDIESDPTAKVLIDGVDTGLTTPVTNGELKLQAGKHKVTFVIGEDRFTYPVLIEAGKTATISKVLR